MTVLQKAAAFPEPAPVSNDTTAHYTWGGRTRNARGANMDLSVRSIIL